MSAEDVVDKIIDRRDAYDDEAQQTPPGATIAVLTVRVDTLNKLLEELGYEAEAHDRDRGAGG